MVMRILIFGDTHIPERANRIPREFTEIIERLDFYAAVITGDLTSHTVLDFAKKVAEKIYVVRGNMDILDLPASAKFEIEGIKFGVVHGHQVYPRGDREQLQDTAEEMGADILISGHTHRPDIFKGEKVLLNPGSMTGVWGGGAYSTYPSFMVAEVEEGKIKGRLYRLASGDVSRESFEMAFD